MSRLAAGASGRIRTYRFWLHACLPGSFSKVGECAPCRPGSFSDGSGNSECTDCSPGTYQAAPGATRCDVCGAGNYSANILSCEPCQLGEYCEKGVSIPPPLSHCVALALVPP